MKVTCGSVVACQFIYAHPRCRTSQHRRTFIPLSEYLWNDLGVTLYSMVWDWQILNSEPIIFIGILIIFIGIGPGGGYNRNEEVRRRAGIERRVEQIREY